MVFIVKLEKQNLRKRSSKHAFVGEQTSQPGSEAPGGTKKDGFSLVFIVKLEKQHLKEEAF